MKNIYLQCVECNKTYPADGSILTCLKHNCKFSYLEVIYDYSSVKNFPDSYAKNWDSFLDLLPIKEFKINLNEISTEPIRLNNLGKILGYPNLYLKDETKNATGSFKDKESIININKSLEFGYQQVYTVSSGNGAISASAYATKARVECQCFVPKETHKAKLNMIEILGGKICKMSGSYEEVYMKTISSKVKGWNITSGFNPYGIEGNKITAFEIWKKIKVPDYILVPSGNGGNLYGIWKGFYELNLLGITKKMPKMIAVQIQDAAPLLNALKLNKQYVILKNIPHSLAEGIVASESYTSPKAVKAILQSKGQVITVTDFEIKKALAEIIKVESIVPEVTSASVFAALPKLKCSVDATVVLIMTGTGMKYLEDIDYLIND